MKRAYFILTLVISVLILIGCSDRETESLKNQVSELQDKLNVLMNSASDGTVSFDAGAGDMNNPLGSDLANAPDPDNAAATNENSDTSDERVSSVKSRVDSLSSDADAVIKDGKDFDKFISLKQEMHSIERSIEDFEDEIEKDYRSGKISRESYALLDRELEAEEDRLDNIEDKLERAFGIFD